MMKVIVVSNTPWNNSNSFGISFSNIFSGIQNLQFANIYCSTGTPDNELQMVCFQITVKSLIKNLWDKKKPTGHIVLNRSNEGTVRTDKEQQSFDKARLLRWQILFWGRDLIWKIGRWKSPELCAFLDEFQPDIIFQPVYFSSYLNDIAQFVKRYTKVPMVGYISDDNYTLRQFRLSPLYWIDRLWKRKKVKRTINMCEILYVISDIQKREYEKIFNPPCSVLTKCADFYEPAPTWGGPYCPIKLVYAGNISRGRYASLLLITEAMGRLNKDKIEAELHIYTSSPLADKDKERLSASGCFLKEAVSYAKLIELQKDADILVHVEGIALIDRLKVHQSFSTKLVDYFELGKCIFAVGTYDEASIKHLLDNDAAIVAQNKNEVFEQLKRLINEPHLIVEYGRKAYKCGQQFHNRNQMQSMIINDLQKVIKNEDITD